MAYLTPDGDEIKKVAIEVPTLKALFSKFVEQESIPFELLGKIDSLEFEIMQMSEVLEMEE